MVDTLLLDTHVVTRIVLEAGDRTSTVRTKVVDFWRDGGNLLVSAVTAWELAQLASRGRLDLGRPVADWWRDLIGRSGISAVPVTDEIGLLAYDLADFPHGDPADRLLVATAVAHGCPLVTLDREIIEFAKRQGAACGFVVVH